MVKLEPKHDIKISPALWVREKNLRFSPVGPGLAQLLERLTHRYSESTSLNPGNLTSATVCGDRSGWVPAAKRSACGVSEVDLRECTFASAIQIRQPTLASIPRGDVTRNLKQGYQWPQIGHTCPPKTLKKRKIWSCSLCVRKESEHSKN